MGSQRLSCDACIIICKASRRELSEGSGDSVQTDMSGRSGMG